MSSKILAAWAVAASLVPHALGCNKNDDKAAREPASQTAAQDSNKSARVDGQPKRQPVKPPEPEMPKVAMTAEHEASCKINVGDPMPVATLVDLEGQSQNEFVVWR